MHQSNNDTSKDSYEWTLSRSDFHEAGFAAWDVRTFGIVHNLRVNIAVGVRPVFHLTSDARTIDGDGSYSNPYILE